MRMTNNEKLIEEAAKALRTQALGGLKADHPEFYQEMSRAVLAVFEKAHTPTDAQTQALRVLEEVEPLAEVFGNSTAFGRAVIALRRLADERAGSVQ